MPVGVGPSEVLIKSRCDNDSGSVQGFILTSATNGTFSEFDYPGAVSTSALGINDQSQVVGYYIGNDGGMHGWGGIPAMNRYITIDYPDSIACEVNGITNAGHLVGEYTDQNHVQHGFLAIPD